MKLEQACRFRTDSGYGICARSEGFTSDHEANMGSIFNDVMNPLFGKMGQQILACGAGGGDVFFARCTMRSDIKGRKTMFTNACVLPAQVYEQEMGSDPAFLLRFPTTRLMSYQPADGTMPPLEVPEGAAIPGLTELREKYGLDQARYAELLLGGYRAMTGNGALCLRTKRAQEETEEAVIELACCVAAGLMPMLRGKLSFSSGQDARMHICMASADGGHAVKAPGSMFPLEAPGGTASLRGVDELTANFFLALAGCDDVGRAQLLTDMQSWLATLSGAAPEGVTLAMIVAAYYLSGQREYSGSDAARLLSSVLVGARSRDLQTAALDGVLTRLLERMIQEGTYPGNLIRALLDRYLVSESRAYCAAVRQVLALAEKEDLAELVAELLERPYGDRERDLLCGILEKMPPSAGILRKETVRQLISWVLANDVAQMLDYCADLLERYPAAEKKGAAEQILADAGHGLKRAEQGLLNALLGGLIECRLTEQTCLAEGPRNILDGLYDRMGPDLQDTSLSYLMLVRLDECRDLTERVSELETLRRRAPALFELAWQKLQAGDEYRLLRESLQAAIRLTEAATRRDMMAACQAYNVFLQSTGPFETKVFRLWTQQMGRELAAENSLSGRAELLKEDFELIRTTRITRESRWAIWTEDVAQFWKRTSYQELLGSDCDIFYRICDFDETEIRKKVKVWNCAKAMRKNGQNGRDILALMSKGELYTASELEEIQAALLLLAKGILAKQQFVAWDLLLLHCRQEEGEGTAYDLRKLVALVEEMDRERLLPRSMPAQSQHSLLLAEDAALRKKLRRLAAGKDVRLLQKLAEELAPEKRDILGNITGFASSLGGAFTRDKEPPSTPADRDFRVGRRLRGGKMEEKPGCGDPVHKRGGKRSK